MNDAFYRPVFQKTFWKYTRPNISLKIRGRLFKNSAELFKYSPEVLKPREIFRSSAESLKRSTECLKSLIGCLGRATVCLSYKMGHAVLNKHQTNHGSK